MKLIRELDEQVWRDFVDAHPCGNVFHTPEMFRIFAETDGFEPELWGVVDGADRPLVLMLPVKVTIIEGFLRVLTTRAVVYGSILCAANADSRNALAFLLRTYRKEVDKCLLYTELRNLSDLADFQPVFGEHGFVYEKHLNYLIDLDRSLADLMQSFGRRTRKHIRRGLRQGAAIVKEIVDPGLVPACYELIAKSYANARVPLADLPLFEKAFQVLFPKGMVKFLLVTVDGASAAAAVELTYKKTIYGWYSGIDRKYGNYNPNELLMWHILRWGVEHGFKTYDFGGAGKPGEPYSVRDFKAKFGGQLVCYGRNILNHAPKRLAISKCGYQMYRILRRFR